MKSTANNILLVLTLVLIGCGGEGTPPTQSPLPDKELAKFQVCEEDSDCVGAVNGCCPCSDTIAINNGLSDEFESQFDCTDVLCPLKACEPLVDPIFQCNAGLCDVMIDNVD